MAIKSLKNKIKLSCLSKGDATNTLCKSSQMIFLFPSVLWRLLILKGSKIFLLLPPSNEVAECGPSLFLLIVSDWALFWVAIDFDSFFLVLSLSLMYENIVDHPPSILTAFGCSWMILRIAWRMYSSSIYCFCSLFKRILKNIEQTYGKGDKIVQIL